MFGLVTCGFRVELRGFEPLTYSMRTRLPGRLLPQAVLTLGEIAAQSVGTVGRGKLLQILLRTHSVPTADRHLGQQTRSAGLEPVTGRASLGWPNHPRAVLQRTRSPRRCSDCEAACRAGLLAAAWFMRAYGIYSACHIVIYSFPRNDFK